MSYDVRVCGTDCDENYTSNMASAWCEAGIMLHEWHGKLACECLPALNVGIAMIASDPERFRKHEPGNGWGHVDTMLVFLRKIRNACEENPSGLLEVSR